MYFIFVVTVAPQPASFISPFSKPMLHLNQISSGGLSQDNHNQIPSYQTLQNPWQSINYLSANNPQNAFINNGFNLASTASRPSNTCSQCQITIGSLIGCKTCHRSFCITCISQGRFNSCLFCTIRFSYSLG
jgi:hypothetical protein